MRARRTELIRPWDERIIGGVSAGLSNAFSIDVTLVRVVFVLLVFAGGLGLLLYGVLWLLMPQPGVAGRDVRWVARHNLTELPNEITYSSQRLRETWGHAGDRRWLAAGLVLSGVLVLLWSFGAFVWLSGTRVVGLVALLIGGGILWGATGSEGRR